MASKKGQGSTSNGRNSPGQRLGIKAFGGETVTAGSILARQHGTRWAPGDGVGIGKDATLYALRAGIVKFAVRHGKALIKILPA